MRSFTYSVHIDRAPEAVWNYMLDFSQASRWRNLVRTVEVLTPGPVRLGSELKVTYDALGKVRSTISDVWSFEPGRRFGTRNTEENVTGVFEYRLEPERDGTRVTFSCDVQPHGFMWLVLPFLLRGNKLRYSEQLPNLKKEVEKKP
jgi:uncharacterized protein YndB with AHSA1/START domain